MLRTLVGGKRNRLHSAEAACRRVESGQLNFFLLRRGGGGLRGLRFDEALLEFIHAAGGIHELLRAGVKRMAGIANADDDGGFGGTRLDHVAAGATDFCVRVFRMNVRLHKRSETLSRISRMTRRNFTLPNAIGGHLPLPAWQVFPDFIFAPAS